MIKPAWQKNDVKARWLIFSVSVIVFIAVVILSKIQWKADLPFDVHVFATINALINSAVALFLLMALWAVKRQNYLLHKRIMLLAILLSVFFLLSYIAHHLLAGETKFGDVNSDGVLSGEEKLSAGNTRFVYYALLLTHIPLAAIVLPFILFTAYRSMIGEYVKHKKLARFTWPIWFFVAVSGVIVYWMIKPYYN